MGREPFLRRCRSTFPCTTLTRAGVSGITWYFYQLSPSEGYVTHVLLTSPPFSGKQASPAIRLACLRRAASVRSEPGSNSPWLFISPKANDSISVLIPFLLERNLQHTFSFLTCMQHLVFIVRKNSFFQTPFPVRLQTSFKEDILLTLLFLFLPWLFFSNIFHPLTYRRVIWLYHIFTFFFKYLLRKKIKKMLFFNFITMIFQFFQH